MTTLTLVLQASPTDINSGDTAWVLMSAALVLLMTPGLAFFYGDLVRSKNMLNTLMMRFVALGLIAIGAIVSFGVIQLFSKFNLDDSLDVFACHGMGGVTGALLTGVFASEAVGGSNGLLYGDSSLMWPQLEGGLAAAGLAGVATAIILYGLKFTIGLRPTEDDERFGLDVTEHAEEAYRR